MSALHEAKETDYDCNHAGLASSRPTGGATRAPILSVANWLAAAAVHLHFRFRYAAARDHSAWLYRNVAAGDSRLEHDAVEHAGRSLTAGDRFRLDERDRRSIAGPD